jgi:glucuronoarabinoxylan endo-1,4-beta-xylanase
LQAELQESGQSSTYPIIDTKTVTADKWVKLSGVFSLEDYDLPLEKAVIYICSADTNTADFYADDFEMYVTGSAVSTNPPITEFPTEPISTVLSYASVSFDKEMQEIQGFGASGAFGTAKSIRNLPDAKREELLELLFDKDKGIGLTVIRNMLTPSIGQTDGVLDMSVDSDQGWLMQEGRKLGVQNIMTTCWTPPAWMKTNNSTIGGSLAKEHYGDFAKYLADYIEAYKEQGTDIDIISPCNEPDFEPTYDGCLWDSEDIADFVKNYLRPELDKRSLGTKILAAEEMSFRANKLSAFVSDSEAATALDIFGVHSYGTSKFSHLTELEATGKPIWMTEIMGYNSQDDSILDGLLWAKRIHQTIAQAGANEWNFWYLAHQYDGGNSAIMVLNKYEDDFTIPKRYYTIGNYSKFIRPGAYRVDSTLVPNSDVYISAYKNTNGQEVIVAANGNVNTQTVDITLTGSDAESFEAYRTSETESLTYTDTIMTENGSHMTIELPPMSVTTYVSGDEDSVRVLKHTFKQDTDLSYYEAYSGTAELSISYERLLAQFTDNWNSKNGIRLNITDHLTGYDKCSLTASVDYLRDNYYDTAASLFFEIKHTDGSTETKMLDSKIGTAGELTTYSGTADIELVSGDTIYLCMTHPTGYQVFDNVILTLNKEENISGTELSLSEDGSSLILDTSEEIEKGVLVTALYSTDDRFMGASTELLSNIKKGRTELQLREYDTETRVRIMLFDDLNGMIPLSNAVILN